MEEDIVVKFMKYTESTEAVINPHTEEVTIEHNPCVQFDNAAACALIALDMVIMTLENIANPDEVWHGDDKFCEPLTDTIRKFKEQKQEILKACNLSHHTF